MYSAVAGVPAVARQGIYVLYSTYKGWPAYSDHSRPKHCRERSSQRRQIVLSFSNDVFRMNNCIALYFLWTRFLGRRTVQLFFITKEPTWFEKTTHVCYQNNHIKNMARSPTDGLSLGKYLLVIWIQKSYPILKLCCFIYDKIDIFSKSELILPVVQ